MMIVRHLRLFAECRGALPALTFDAATNEIQINRGEYVKRTTETMARICSIPLLRGYSLLRIVRGQLKKEADAASSTESRRRVDVRH